MNYPKKYKVLFYISAHLDGLTKISDYTNWLDIPPPEFFLSFPNKLEFRPDESGDISGILKSTSGSIVDVANYTIDNKSVITVIPFRYPIVHPHQEFSLQAFISGFLLKI